MSKRIYHSISSIRRILPEVRVLSKKLMQLDRSVEILDGIEIENENDDLQMESTFNTININFHKKMLLYYKIMQRLVTLGAYVRDLEVGEVDFYTKNGSQEIVLCWVYGEGDILHWHGPKDTFYERKSLKQLKKSEAH
jgi:hypothetical protein